MSEVQVQDLQCEHQQFIAELGDWKRTHGCCDLTAADEGRDVCLMGWAQYRRDHGGLIFVDMRDRDGLTQVVFSPEVAPEAHRTASILRAEYVFAIRGRVRLRPEGMINPHMKTGEIEVVVSEWKLLNTSKTPPFPIEDRTEVGENVRLQWRYLDLRRPRMAANLKLRHKVAQCIRRYLDEGGFLEVETPILTKSTPEGARDFLVPSRLNQGQFYALPQSPQIFKQLLMVSGVDRYFQIVRCFRDEDLRADRQPEFTQVDIEMSFVDEEQVMTMAEGLMARVFRDVMGVDIPLPFPRMKYDEAMLRYGVDKPDTRFGLELVDITDIVRGSNFKVFGKAELVKAMKVEGGERLTRKEIDEFTEFVKVYGAQGLAWIKIRADEWQSPIAKFLSQEERDGIARALDLKVGDIVFFQAGEAGMVNAALGNLRVKLGHHLGLVPENSFNFLWVTEFPLYEYDKEAKQMIFTHNPFSMPQGGLEALNTKNPEDILAYQYDIVCNGVELSSGAVRNHDMQIMVKAFEIAGYTEEDLKEKFGALYNAFQFGAPPHAGMAPGVDRMIMLLRNEENIREVIAFPMNGNAQDLMCGAPGEVTEQQLREVHIKVRQ